MSSFPTDPGRGTRRFAGRAVVVAAMLASFTPWAAVAERLPSDALDLGAMLVLEHTPDTIDRVVIGVVLSFESEVDAQSARSPLVQVRLRDAAGTVLRDVRTMRATDLNHVEDRLAAQLRPHAAHLRDVAVEILGRTSTRRD